MISFFSIIIPTYNRVELISATISSILNQGFEDFEIIIVDDGGTDNTREVIEKFEDKRISYYKKKNGERGAARNYGIAKASGKYVTFIDSDDILYTNAFQNAYENLNSLALPDCYAQAYEVIDQATKKQLQAPANFKKNTVNDEIIKGNFLGCIGVYVKNEILQNVNFEEVRMFAGTEDWLLWLRLAARYPFYFSNEVCAAMIEHADRSVLSFSEEKLVYRTTFLKNALLKDIEFIEYYGLKTINKVYAHMLSYTALHLAISGKRLKAFRYLLKAAKSNINELMRRRTLGIFKTIVILK